MAAKEIPIEKVKKMKRTLLVLAVAGLAIVCLAMLATEADATDYVVDYAGNGDYTTIQDAINASSSGDTIYVWDGTYVGQALVNKSLDIIGNGTDKTTVLDSTTSTFYVRDTSYVNISNMHIGGMYGIRARLMSNLYVFGAEINTTNYGIWLNGSCSHTEIYNNTIFSDDVGVYYAVAGTTHTLHNNTILAGNAGIKVQASPNVVVENNTVEAKTGMLCGTFGLDIRYNVLENCDCGYKVTGFAINNNVVRNNTIRNNGIGGMVSGIAIGHSNIVYNNQFENNIIHAIDNTTKFTYYLASPIGGNYWDNWTSPDIDLDGFVDNPFVLSGSGGAVDHLPIALEVVVVAELDVPVESFWCQNITVYANDSLGADWYLWDWGDSTASNTSIPEATHHYETPGEKTICLTVGNLTTGGMNTTSVLITVEFETTADMAEYAVITWQALLVSVMSIFLLLLIVKKMLDFFQEGLEENR